MSTYESPRPLWKTPTTPERINALAAGSMGAHLGLTVTEIGPDYLTGTLPVDHRTQQPFGRLHGGANVVLAEELGSVAANLTLDPAEAFAVGMEVNANHLRGVMGGVVTGTARPVHIGRSSQVWEIRIVDDRGQLACISRLTVAVVSRTR